MTRQYEKKYATEFFREFFIDKDHSLRVWLGPTPPGKDSRMYSVITKWADAVVREDNKITIIEFKLEPNAKAIGQLLEYKNLFGQTLRFKDHWRKPVHLLLVTTRIDDATKEVADQQGIEYRVFRPEGIEFWEKRRFRI